MQRCRPGTFAHRVPIVDRDGHTRTRDEVIALVARRRWAATATYLGVRGRWHVFERVPTPTMAVYRAAHDRRRAAQYVRKRGGHSTPAANRASRAELRALLEANASLLRGPKPPRPRTRGECVGGPRPCPWVSCRHHLALDINPETGSIRLNFHGLELDQLADTCALDVADRGQHDLAEVGRIFNVTREGIRQIEARGLLHLRGVAAGAGL